MNFFTKKGVSKYIIYINFWNCQIEISFKIIDFNNIVYYQLIMSEIKPSLFVKNDCKKAFLFEGNKMTLWDLEYTYAIKEVIGHLAPISCARILELCNNKSRVITGSMDHRIKLWDSKSCNHIITLKGHNHSIMCIDAFYDNESKTIYIVSGDFAGQIIIWEIDEVGRRFKIISMISCPYGVSCVYLFRDLKRVLSAHNDSKIILWEVEEKNNIYELELSIPSLTFSKKSKNTSKILVFSNENEFLSVSDSNIYHWQMDGTFKGTFVGHENVVNSLQLYDNENRLITGSDDGTIRTWNVLTYSNFHIFDVEYPVYSVSMYSNDKKFNCYASDGILRVFEITSGQLVGKIDMYYRSPAKSPSSRKTPISNTNRRYNISRAENPQVVIERLIATIDKFVPREFRTLISSDYGQCKLGQAILKPITVLFTDIRDFTSLSERMTVKELMDFINLYLAFVVPPIYANNGFVDKFIGDSVMGLFTSDNITEQADNSVLCAIKIQKDLRFMEAVNFTTHVKTGIGINTGRAIVGWVGTETRMDPTVLGDTVNVSSRMESLCKIYGSSIIISEQTKKRLGRKTEMVTLRHLGEVVVKGKSKPCKIYEVVDGDCEEIQVKKKMLLRSGIWDEGLLCYRNSSFQKAIEMFQKCLEIYPDDIPSKLYIERCNIELNRNDKSEPEQWDPIIYLKYK